MFGKIIGKATDKMALRFVLGIDGNIKDPKSVWELLEGAATDKSLSNLIKGRAIQ